MIIISDTPPVREETRSFYVQLLRKGIMVVVATLLLVIGFILAGEPAATAVPASAHNSMPSASGLNILNCNGKTPGFCPDGPYVAA